MYSQGVTSPTNCAPTFSHCGRPSGKLSSTTHCRNSSQKTGQASMTPNCSAAILRSRSLVAGVMRSTIALGKATLDAIQSANVASDNRANPTTALRVTTPLCGTLSQDITVNGLMPFSMRAFKPATMKPNTVDGLSGCAASLAMAAFLGSNFWVAGSMKYPPSVTVIETILIAGSTNFARMAFLS